MKIQRRWLLALALLPLVVSGVSAQSDGSTEVRWDIISLNSGRISPGGIASARAADNSRITVTGSGTFVAPPENNNGRGGGQSKAVTGGGTWQTTGFNAGGGTYEVTGLVKWELAPGTNNPVDLVDPNHPRAAGLAILRVVYSDGQRGILVVSCHLNGTPNAVFEGIIATKGFVTYFNPDAPQPGVDANRTIFHILRD